MNGSTRIRSLHQSCDTCRVGNHLLVLCMYEKQSHNNGLTPSLIQSTLKVEDFSQQYVTRRDQEDLLKITKRVLELIEKNER